MTEKISTSELVRNDETLQVLLRQDILRRYDNQEYWDMDIIREYLSQKEEQK